MRQADALVPATRHGLDFRSRSRMPVRCDAVRRDDAAHQHVDQRRRLRSRIPAVDIERRIRFGDAARLHLGKRASSKSAAALELR